MRTTWRSICHKECALIDLGAGNCEKAVRLFPVFKPARYIAVDISVDFLKVALERWQRQFPTLEMTGVGMDFSSELTLPVGLALKTDTGQGLVLSWFKHWQLHA